MTFKGASSPGRYGQQVAHVDNVSRLQKAQTRDRNDQVRNNKQIADAHRKYSQSFTAGIGTEAASRQNALQFEDYFHQIDQKFKLQGIEDAHASAVRNAELQQQQTNKEANQLVNLVNKTLDTGVDIYKRVEKAKEIQKDNDASAIASQYSTQKEIVEFRRLGRQYLDGEMEQDAFEAAAAAAGRSPESILNLAGVSEGVFTLSLQKTVSNNINNLDRIINTDDAVVPGTGKTGAQIELEGDIAAANVAWQQKVQGMARLYKEQTGQDFPWATFNDPLQKAYSRYIGRISRVNRTNSAAQLQDQQQNKFFNGLGAPTLAGNPIAQADWLVQRQTMYPGLRNKDIDHLIEAAKLGVISQDLLNEFGSRPVLNKDGTAVNGQTYRDMYLTQFLEAEDHLRSGRIKDHQDYAHDQNAIKITTLKAITALGSGGKRFNRADVEAIRQEALNDGADATTMKTIEQTLNTYAMKEGIGIEAAEGWWSAYQNDDQYLEHMTPDMIIAVSPNAEWASDKLKELRSAQRANPFTKDRETYIRNDLAKRLGVHGPDAYKDTSFIPAFREIDTQWQEWAKEGGGGAEGFKYAEAKYEQVYGKANDKTKQFDPATNPLAVFNAADDKNFGKTGFVNYQADASLAGDVGLFRDWSSALSAASGNSTRVSDRLNSLDKIDLSALPAADVERFLKDFHNRKIEPGNQTMDLLRTLGDAITGTKGGNLNVFETAEALADVYNIDRKQFEPQVGVGKDVIDRQNQLQMKYGGSVAQQFTAEWSPAIRGNISEPETFSHISNDSNEQSALDATPAPDATHATAQISNGMVIDKGFDYNANAIGGDGRLGRGWGNWIKIRHTLPNGGQVDILYAHFPDGELDKWARGTKIAQHQPIARYATNAEFDGRLNGVGSGSGKHLSMNAYNVGTWTPWNGDMNLIRNTMLNQSGGKL